jgi:hypothetical protein
MRGGMEARAALPEVTAQGGEVAKTLKSGIEKDTAFYRGYLIDDRSLTSLRIALAAIVAERLSSATCSGPAPSSLQPPWRDGKGTRRVCPYQLMRRPPTPSVLWRLISIASDPLRALPYRA